MRVLILTTDAGGGHRSVARALAAAFEEVSGPGCSVRVVDFFLGYAPFPLSRSSQVYAFLMRYPFLWNVFYTSTNLRRNRAWNAPAVGLAMEAGMGRLLDEHQPDVIVGTHPMAAPPLSALLYRRGKRLPYYTVVTDYGFLHTWWAYPFGELWFAPDAGTAQHLTRAGIPPERVIDAGYPVHPRFGQRTRTSAEIRTALGLDPERFTALLVGGAAGVGPIEEIVEALASRPAPWQLIVVTGRNHALKERLEEQMGRWRVPVHVEGLVDDMPSRMHAADVLLTKAGGSTTSEGLTCGLPQILTSILPGQEEENARYLTQLGAARAATSPQAVRAMLQELANPQSTLLRSMCLCARRAARPRAAHEIARRVLERGQAVTALPLSPFYGLPLPRAHRVIERLPAGRHLRNWLR